MQKVIGVRKEYDKETYYYLTNNELKVGDKVVVSADDFQTIAVVKMVLEYNDKFSELSSIKRVASDADLKKYEDLRQKAKNLMPQVKTKSLKLGLMMKFIGMSYSLDGSKVIIIFSSEDRVDFRQFLKDLASMLKTRIELKQIGQRDEVKVCGGVGPCGEECCCARFLKDFEHVTVKMAKTQGLSLSPTKINGICGRLMCCLGYESSQYDEILSKMPKINSEINTPNGKGVVVYNDILRERVSVKRQTDAESFVVEDFALEELSIKRIDNFKTDKDAEIVSENQIIEDVIEEPNKDKKIKKEKFKNKFYNKKK